MKDVNTILAKKRVNYAARQKSDLSQPKQANILKRQTTALTLACSAIGHPTIPAKHSILYNNYKSNEREKLLNKILKLFSSDLNEENLKLYARWV